MSVLTIDLDELANVARTLAPGGSDIDTSMLATWLQHLALLSSANARTFRERYPRNHGNARGFTAEEIRKAMPSPIKVQPKRASDTLRSLAYNTDYEGNPKEASAMASLAIAMMTRAAKRAYAGIAAKPIIPESAPGQPINLMSMIPKRVANAQTVYTCPCGEANDPIDGGRCLSCGSMILPQPVNPDIPPF